MPTCPSKSGGIYSPAIYHTMDDPGHVLRERMTLDTSGHYQRPDIFELKIKGK